MNALTKRIVENRSGFILAFAAVLFVGGWRLLAVLHHPIDWRQVASELGSVPQFRQDLMANHHNTALVFSRDVEAGVGLFLCDLTTHQIHLLGEQSFGRLDIYGWSADDQHFAFGRALSDDAKTWELVICDGQSGQILDHLKHPGFAGPDKFVWLSSNSFGYFKRDSFITIERGPDGNWHTGKTLPNISANASGFTAVSSSAVAWQEWLKGGVVQEPYRDSNQQWSITQVGNNQYKITATNGLALTSVQGRSQLELQPFTGRSDQLWGFKPNGTNYNIQNIGTKQNMDDWGGGSDTMVGQWDANSSNSNQIWRLERIASTSTLSDQAGVIPDGVYKVSCPLGGDNALSYFGDDGFLKISMLDTGSGSIKTILKCQAGKLSDFSYCQEARKFLINCVNKDGEKLLCYNPFTQRTDDVGRGEESKLGTLRKFSTWNDDYDSPLPVFTSLSGSGSVESVYLSDDGLNTFYLRTNINSTPVQLLWGGGMTVHTSLNNGHLYVAGSLTNEPPDIWHYNAADGSLERITLAPKRFEHAKYVTPVYGQLTNELGKVTGYSLWSPADVSSQKKYPVIITQTVEESEVDPEIAANCGYYFVVAHRPYWLSKKLEDGGSDIMNLHDLLKKNPNVDANRIFLAGRSAEMGWLTQLIAEHQALWKGVILFDPGGLPPLEDLRGKRLVIITGADAKDAHELEKLQAQALDLGISVKLVLQKGMAHVLKGVGLQRERAMDFAKVLAEGL